jgi:hypothetical protein
MKADAPKKEKIASGSVDPGDTVDMSRFEYFSNM